jgi:hypothetical protein
MYGMHVIDPVTVTPDTVYVDPVFLSQSVTILPYVVPDQLTVVSNNRYIQNGTWKFESKQRGRGTRISCCFSGLLDSDALNIPNPHWNRPTSKKGMVSFGHVEIGRIRQHLMQFLQNIRRKFGTIL